jgi:ketosteroid isomerase-like protein
MATNADLIERFYAAFGARDGAAMAACYTPDAVFTDPVFGELRGADPGRMWIMLTDRAQDLAITLESHSASDTDGQAHWLADYTFATTGRAVHNDVHARFAFRDGLIAEHHDDFSFYAWSRQALGPAGLLLGWTPLLKRKVRGQALAGLAAAPPAG